MNRVSQNVDLISKPYFYQYQKASEGPFQVFHAHKGIEFMFIHEGAGRVILEQEQANVTGGTLLIFRPFQLHKLVMDASLPFIRSILIFEASRLEPYLRTFPQLRTLFMQLSDNPSFPHRFGPLTDQRWLNELFGDFHIRTSESIAAHLTEYFNAFMISLLQKLQLFVPGRRAAPAHQPSPTPHHHAITIMQWIDNHYADDFSLADLSKTLHLSTYYVSHLFREATGENISTYLTNRRIREVCLLLKASSLSLQDIGRRVGMPNIPHLCTVFKKNMNMTPMQYRKMFEAHMTGDSDL